MKLSRTVALAAILSIASVSAARAQNTGTILNGTYSGGNNFTTTASVVLSYAETGVGTGVYVFTLNVTNMGIYGEVYKAVGLMNVASGYTLVSSDGPTGWHLPPPNDLGGAGLEPEIVAMIAPDPAPDNGLKYGESGLFHFTISGLTLAQVQDVGFAVHAISGPNSCSTKLGVRADGSSVESAPDYQDCTVVPEPASTALLATGLLGLLGFAWIRRRRGQPVVWEEGA